MLNQAKEQIGNEFFGAPGAEVKLGTELANKKHVVRCNWKFSRDGGAVGAIDLKDALTGEDAVLPKGFVVHDSLIVVKTAVTSGGSATLALTANSAADVKAATAVASFSANAIIAGVPVGTALTAVLCTAARTPTLTVAVAALTAGEFDVFLEGFYQERA